MSENNHPKEEILSKVLRAGRRTYFFDVQSTRADDYYLTVTESKKHTRPDGSSYYKKHKIYLYKEDFVEFRDLLNEMTEFIFDKKGKEIITDDFDDETPQEVSEGLVEEKFTNVNFEEL